MIATLELADSVAGRDQIKRSHAIKTYHPESAALWEKQLKGFKTVLTKER